MPGTVSIASPWWVNLLILIPLVPFLLFRKDKMHIGGKRLVVSALFAVAFGFVEAAVVVYLRASTGMLPGQRGHAPVAFPETLLRIEVVREAATMVMLGTIAVLAGRNVKERAVAFLWTFAVWDIFYYLWLAVTIGWPNSLLNTDLLFLIPVPWFAQVWFPLLVSSLTIAGVWLCSRKAASARRPALQEQSPFGA